MKEQDIGTIIWDSAATTVVTHFSTYTTSKYMRTSIYRYIYIYIHTMYTSASPVQGMAYRGVLNRDRIWGWTA